MQRTKSKSIQDRQPGIIQLQASYQLTDLYSNLELSFSIKLVSIPSNDMHHIVLSMSVKHGGRCIRRSHRTKVIYIILLKFKIDNLRFRTGKQEKATSSRRSQKRDRKKNDGDERPPSKRSRSDIQETKQRTLQQAKIRKEHQSPVSKPLTLSAESKAVKGPENSVSCCCTIDI